MVEIVSGRGIPTARNRRAEARDGFILVAVLAVMALLAGLVGAVSLLVRSTVDSALVGADRLAGDALVRAGVELAAYQLYAQRLPAEAIDGQQVRLGAGTVTLFVTSEAGKVDLNGADPALLAGIWRVARAGRLPPEAFAARVVDWRDEDDEPSEDGAEAETYRAEGLRHVPQNDAFRSVDDLQWVLGLSPDEVKALAALVTVNNPAGTIDLFEAPRDVLLALPGVGTPTVDRILSLRAERSAEVAQQLVELLPDQQAFVTTEPGASYRVLVEARRGDGNLSKAEIVLTRGVTEDALYHVVAWTE